MRPARPQPARRAPDRQVQFTPRRVARRISSGRPRLVARRGRRPCKDPLALETTRQGRGARASRRQRPRDGAAVRRRTVTSNARVAGKIRLSTEGRTGTASSRRSSSTTATTSSSGCGRRTPVGSQGNPTPAEPAGQDRESDDRDFERSERWRLRRRPTPQELQRPNPGQDAGHRLGRHPGTTRRPKTEHAPAATVATVAASAMQAPSHPGNAP